ncbi:MAG: hypothetical protein KKG59_05850 [Nanoarchaeota archaeon]|nr:hypothetical protein [Nanoarchaeota archaeon]
MKHTALVTFFLVLVFVVTQTVGLGLISSISSDTYIDEEGNKQIASDETTVDLTPTTQGLGSLLYIIIAVGIGTALFLLIVKFNKVGLWKVWFFLAVAIAVGISFKVLLKGVIPNVGLLGYIPWVLGIGFALLKMYSKSVIFYNVTEILMYSGIALILAPIFSMTYAIILLILISVYDMIAVWKSKHMVKMAKFQSNSKMFAGLMIPYSLKKPKKIGHDKKKDKIPVPHEPKTAILGGGDVTFPLIFEGVFLRMLILSGIAANMALAYTMIIVATTTIALTILFLLAEKDKFYPAMPFISGGCFVGWLIAGAMSGIFL